MKPSPFSPKVLIALGVCSLFGLSIAANEAASRSTSVNDSKFESATFSMYCYWTGEATLGRVDGVVASRIGHWGGAEIVQVDYDPGRTNVDELASALKKQRSFYSQMVSDASGSPAAASLDADEIKVRKGKPHFIDPKHSLRTRNPQLLELDLSEQQAIALNSWSYFGGPMPDILTAEQKQHLSKR